MATGFFAQPLRVTQAANGDNVSTVATTSSTSYVDLDGTNTDVTITTTGGDVLVWVTASLYSSVASDTVFLAVAMDSAAEVGELLVGLPSTAVQAAAMAMARFAAPAAGSHTFKARWRGATAGNTYSCDRRHIVVEELKR